MWAHPKTRKKNYYLTEFYKSKRHLKDSHQDLHWTIMESILWTLRPSQVLKYMKHGSDAVWWTVWSESGGCTPATPPHCPLPYLLIQLHTGPQAVGLVSVHNYLFTHCPKPPRIIGSTPPSFGSWEAGDWRKAHTSSWIPLLGNIEQN